jgi:putative hydrolase of the HAD superfamily
MWCAVVFDLDDTLVAERDFALGGFRAAAARAAVGGGVAAERAYDELVALYRSGVRGTTFDRWLAARGGLGVTVDELVDAYRHHTPTLTPLPGVEGLLEELKRVYRLGLVSDGLVAVQERKWLASGLAPYFDAVVFSDALGRDAWKPSPRPFLAVSEALAIPPAECVYVGDNPAKDFRGARAAGMRSVWARHAGGEYDGSTVSGAEDQPDWTTCSIEELAGVLLHPPGQAPA